MRSRAAALAAITAACVLLGCRSGGPPPIANAKPVHPVSGKVLMGGKPAAGALVIFVPVDEPAENAHPRPRAEVSADGSYVLSTYGEKDGAPVGEYKVMVMWEDPESHTDRFQGRYDAGNSRLKATVKEGTNEIPPIQLK